MTVRGPGDSVPIKTRLDDGTLLSDRFVITYFDPERSLLYTCGHCFPSNASLQRPDGELVSTSGYMDPDRDDGVEVAVVRIWNTLRFRPTLRDGTLLVISGRIVPPQTIVHLYREDSRIEGTLLGRLSGGRVVYKDTVYRVEDMPRVNEPCIVIGGQRECDEYAGGCLPTFHGFSGSPWGARLDDGRVQLVGSHVAKVVLESSSGERMQASIAVPVDRMLRAAAAGTR